MRLEYGFYAASGAGRASHFKSTPVIEEIERPTPMSTRKVTRREFVGTATFMALGMPVVLGRAYPALAGQAAKASGAVYTPPRSPRTILNFNIGWKFIKDPGGSITRRGGAGVQRRGMGHDLDPAQLQ